MPVPEPDDDALLELGRVTWAAINVEDIAYTLARFIKPRHGPFNDHPIGARIKEARADLVELYVPDAARDAADAWLAEAAAVLAARNAIFHSVPVTFDLIPGTTSVEESLGQWLAHFPRDKSKGAVHTKLTSAALLPIRRRLDAARQGWMPPLNALTRRVADQR